MLLRKKARPAVMHSRIKISSGLLITSIFGQTLKFFGLSVFISSLSIIIPHMKKQIWGLAQLVRAVSSVG